MWAEDDRNRDHKRRRDERGQSSQHASRAIPTTASEGDEDIETRLRNLIIKVGDKVRINNSTKNLRVH